MTNSKPCERYRSSRSRRHCSIRRACAGRISDRCSGNSQFDINNLPVESIGRLRGFALAVGLGPETEEAGFGAQYQRVARIRKRLAIAFQALVERVEVGVLAVGLGIDGRGLGVAVTPNGLS